MTLMRIRPFGEVSTLQNEINTMFDRFFGREAETERAIAPVFVAANLTESNDHITVTAEIPGINPKDLDISVTGDLLTIKGEKKAEKEEKGETCHRIERSYGSFSRSWVLPAPVVLDKVSADYKDGVLRVTLPKTDDSKRREVKIKVG